MYQLLVSGSEVVVDLLARFSFIALSLSSNSPGLSGLLVVLLSPSEI